MYLLQHERKLQNVLWDTEYLSTIVIIVLKLILNFTALLPRTHQKVNRGFLFLLIVTTKGNNNLIIYFIYFTHAYVLPDIYWIINNNNNDNLHIYCIFIIFFLHFCMFICFPRNEIFIAPSGVQKERIKVSVFKHHTNRILTRYIFFATHPIFLPKMLISDPKSDENFDPRFHEKHC